MAASSSSEKPDDNWVGDDVAKVFEDNTIFTILPYPT